MEGWLVAPMHLLQKQSMKLDQKEEQRKRLGWVGLTPWINLIKTINEEKIMCMRNQHWPSKHHHCWREPESANATATAGVASPPHPPTNQHLHWLNCHCSDRSSSPLTFMFTEEDQSSQKATIPLFLHRYIKGSLVPIYIHLPQLVVGDLR